MKRIRESPFLPRTVLFLLGIVFVAIWYDMSKTTITVLPLLVGLIFLLFSLLPTKHLKEAGREET